jgi:hypothetical protein
MRLLFVAVDVAVTAPVVYVRTVARWVADRW